MPALRLQLRTTCVTCGNPIPLTSATLPVKCPTCDAPSALGTTAFRWVNAEGVTHRAPDEGATLLGEAAPARVQCGACKAFVDDAAVEGALVAARPVACSCGRSIAVRRVPGGLDRDGWWSAVVGESERQTVAPTAEPVAFTCQRCGGALLVDGATRTPPCKHCGVRAYLPDDLWRSLRPTPRAEPFYLWVDPAWLQLWTEKKRAALAWHLLSIVLAYGGTALVGVIVSLCTDPPNWDYLQPALIAGIPITMVTGAIVGARVVPRRVGGYSPPPT
jgi:DNA-directed RNA polymerase subunit RPC12/RpoP